MKSKPRFSRVATIGYDDFVGRIAVGRIQRGTVRKGDTITCIGHDGKPRKGRVGRLSGFEGLEQVEIDSAQAGHIVGIAGFTDALLEKRCVVRALDQLPPIAVDEPTISMEFFANSGPLSGQSGKYVTSRN